ALRVGLGQHLGDGGGEAGLAVVDVGHRPDVHVDLVAAVMLLGAVHAFLGGPAGRPGAAARGRAARTGEGSRVGATWRTLVRPASSRPSTVDPRPWARPAGR